MPYWAPPLTDFTVLAEGKKFMVFLPEFLTKRSRCSHGPALEETKGA